MIGRRSIVLRSPHSREECRVLLERVLEPMRLGVSVFDPRLLDVLMSALEARPIGAATDGAARGPEGAGAGPA